MAHTWGELREDDQDWPTDEQWDALRAADRLDELEPALEVTADDAGAVRLDTELPMPSMSLLTLTVLSA